MYKGEPSFALVCFPISFSITTPNAEFSKGYKFSDPSVINNSAFFTRTQPGIQMLKIAFVSIKKLATGLLKGKIENPTD